MQYPFDHPRRAPDLPALPLPPILYPYHGFCIACVRGPPSGYVPLRERLTIVDVCQLCAELSRPRTLLTRPEREHPVYFLAIDQIQLLSYHVSSALEGPPQHEHLERYLLVLDPAPVSSGTQSVPVNVPARPWIIYNSSDEEEAEQSPSEVQDESQGDGEAGPGPQG